MPLPRLPLNALRAFETTARLGSMSAAAANELGVTHGAVSRHVQGLEADSACRSCAAWRSPLSRRRRGPAGGESRRGFRADAARRVTLAPSPLTLSCSATIMMHWLIPRLGGFKHDNPGVEIRLNVNYGEVDFVRDEISLAIRSSMFKPPQDVVFGRCCARISPICHPDYAARLGLHAPEDLARARILGTATRPAAWGEWLSAIDRPDLTMASHEHY